MEGCGEQAEQAESEPVQAGQTLRPLGFIQYYKKPPYSREDPVYPLTSCQLVANGRAIVIVDIRAEYCVIQRREDCSGPYGTWALSIPVEVVAVAAGPPIERSFNLIVVGGGGIEQRPKAGETWLFGMRRLDDDWHLTGHSRLTFSDEPFAPQRDVELPGTFEELSAETSARLEDFDEVCVDDHANRVSDEVFRDRREDPDFWGCTPSGPNVPPPTPCDDLGEILTECSAPEADVDAAVASCNERLEDIREAGHRTFLGCLETLARRACTPPTDSYDDCDPSPTGACARLATHIAAGDSESSGYQRGRTCENELAGLDEARQNEVVDCLIALDIDLVISGYWESCLPED